MSSFESESVVVVIPGPPRPWVRARVNTKQGGAQHFDSPPTRSYKGMAQVHMQEEMGMRAPLEGPLQAWILAVFPLPKSKHRKTQPVPRQWHEGKVDADNLAKLVLDAGNGILYLDDGQVADLRVRKIVGRQGEAPRVELVLRQLRHGELE